MNYQPPLLQALFHRRHLSLHYRHCFLRDMNPLPLPLPPHHLLHLQTHQSQQLQGTQFDSEFDLYYKHVTVCIVSYYYPPYYYYCLQDCPLLSVVWSYQLLLHLHSPTPKTLIHQDGSSLHRVTPVLLNCMSPVINIVEIHRHHDIVVVVLSPYCHPHPTWCYYSS